MLNAIQGGQVLAEFRGISPAERDRLVTAMGDKIRDRRVELDAQPVGRIQCREEAVRRCARAPRAARWPSTAGVAARASPNFDTARGRRRLRPGLADGDAGSELIKLSRLLEGHQCIPRGGQAPPGAGRRAESQIHSCTTATLPCPIRRLASSWSTNGGRSALPPSTSNSTPRPYIDDLNTGNYEVGHRLHSICSWTTRTLQLSEVPVGQPVADNRSRSTDREARQALRLPAARA